MKSIGGYFELEFNKGEHYHKDAIKLNTARSCFEYILRARGYQKVYMPYYTCPVMFHLLLKLGIQYSCYNINESFEITKYPILQDNEAILYTNYFGLKQRYVEILAIKYGSKLIVDNAQAFYSPRINCIDTFYSARKFFGVPDGAYLYSDVNLHIEIPQDISLSRVAHLLKRIDYSAEEGYQDFKKSEQSLDQSPILLMSKLTESILTNVDYEQVAKVRRKNYELLNKALQNRNQISLDLCQDYVPMVYPYVGEYIDLRNRLIANRVFVPKYWENDVEVAEFESALSQRLIPLPIDQRYSDQEMNLIISLI